MSTEAWILVWKVVLYGALVLFAVLSVWVILFGARDIRHMFADLREQADDRD